MTEFYIKVYQDFEMKIFKENSVILLYGNSDLFLHSVKDFVLDISDFEKEKAKKFMMEKDHNNYIISHYFLRRELAKVLKKSIHEVNICFPDMEKPYLSGVSVDFNLSHSTNFFALVISSDPDISVGIDIETIHNMNYFESITKRYMHADEGLYILDNGLPHNEKLFRFFEIWTRKEAFLKMNGLGISDELNKINMVSGEKSIFFDVPSNFEIKSDKAYILTFNLNSFIISVSCSEKCFLIPKEIAT